MVYKSRYLSQCLSNMSPPTNSVEFTTGKRGNDNVIYMSTKKIVAQTVSSLDFESREKLGYQLNCFRKIVRSSRTAANRHPPNTAYYQEHDSNTILDDLHSIGNLSPYTVLCDYLKFFSLLSITLFILLLDLKYKFAST